MQVHLAADSVGSVQPGCTSATRVHKLVAGDPVPPRSNADDMAALEGATVGKRVNTNRALRPFAHVYYRGTYGESQSYNATFGDRGLSSIVTSGAGDMEERGRALETFVEERKVAGSSAPVAGSCIFEPSLLLGNQVLHELGPFLLIGLDAFV